MRDARLIQTGEIDPSEVDAERRMRKVSDAGVQSLMTSYKQLGVFKDGVDLRRVKGRDKPVLMAGGHRLEAARRMGVKVPYKIWDCTNTWAELCEIDDNAAGQEMSTLDTAVFLVKRKALHEKLFPETKAGVAGGLARQNLASDMLSFAEATAEKYGVSKRKIERLVGAGAALTGDQARWLKSAPKPVTLADLQALSKIADDHERSQVCIALSNGDAKSAAEAVRQRQADTPVKDPVEEAFKSLRQAWARAPRAARRRFLEADFEALTELLAEVDADSDERERETR